MADTENLAYGMDPTTREFLRFLAAAPGPQLHELSPAEARTALGAASKDVEHRAVNLRSVTVPVGSSAGVSVTFVRPKERSGTLPVVMYFHGGGWVLGDFRTFRRCCVDLAYGADVEVGFVNYSLAPEAKYPVPIEECYAATKWVAENGHTIGVDQEKLAIVGESAGGAIAAAVALLARERGGPKLAAQVLHCPVTDLAAQTGSRRDFATGHFLSEKLLQWCLEHYEPRAAEPLASPLRASLDKLRGLPPTLVVTAEFDPIRDEGEAFARRLTEAGVPVTATRYLGAIHAFMSLEPLKDTPAAAAAIAQTCAMLREAFAER